MKNVFILEDSKTDAYHLKTMLERNGYTVVGNADNGAEAVEKVLQLKPDLIFVDIILKGKDMDGIDAALEISKHIDVPIILLSHYSEEHIVERALQVSPYAYLIKPVNEDQLRVTLETTKNMLRMKKEREELVGQLYQSQKMDAIGQLAGGMAHNYNNILSVILGNAELVLKDSEPGDPNYDRVNKIIRSITRGSDLTVKLLALARKEKLDVKTITVNEIIEDVLDILESAISKKINIKTAIDDNLPPVCVDANQVVQAVLNICINACDAMPDGGVLYIECERVKLDERTIEDKAGLNPGEHILIRVRDTGGGIPKEIREKIFEPFFTTKDKGKGTGLGLYVTHTIIKGHNGHIAVDGEESGGASMSVYLPASVAPARPAEEKCAEKTRIAGTETILIVDDEEDFLDMISETMKLRGYRTFVASSGGKAVELFMKHHGEIDLVLLDIMMPEMDGGEVFNALRKISPDVKVVLCSGYSNKGKVEELINEGVAAFVQKPFVFTELESAISNAISA